MSAKDWLRSCVVIDSTPRWASGIVAAFTFAVPALIGLATGVSTSVLIFPLAAFMVINMMPADTWLIRRVTSGVIGSVAAAVAVFCSLEVAPFIVIAALLFGLFNFLTGVFASLGRAWITAAIIMPVIATIGFGLPGTPFGEVLALSLGAMLGGLWAVVVAVLVAVVGRQHPVLDSLALMYRDVAQNAAALRDVTRDPNRVEARTSLNDARASATSSIEHAIDVTKRPYVTSRRTRRELAQARAQVVRAIAVSAVLAELEYVLARASEPAPTEIAEILEEVGDWLTSQARSLGSEDASVSTASVVAFVNQKALGIGVNSELTRELTAVLRALPDALDEIPDTQELPVLWADVNPFSVLGACLTPGSMCMRYAGRVAVAATIAGLLAGFLNSLHGWWIAITIVVVMKAGIGDTVTTMARRIAGTLVGALIVCVLSYFLSGHNVAIVLVIACVAVPMVALREINYAYWAAGMSTFLLLSMTINAPPVGWESSALRIVDTLIGGAICIACTLLLWPSRSARSIPLLIVNDLHSTSDFVRATADPSKQETQLLELRRQHVRAECDVRAAIDAAREEGSAARAVAQSSTPVADNCRAARNAAAAFGRDLRADESQYSQQDLERVAATAANIQQCADLVITPSATGRQEQGIKAVDGADSEPLVGAIVQCGRRIQVATTLLDQ